LIEWAFFLTGASFGFGRSVETGFSFDTMKCGPACFSRNGCINGKAVGIAGSFDVGTGQELIMWFDFQNERFPGFTTTTRSGSIGAGGFAGKARTRVLGTC